MAERAREVGWTSSRDWKGGDEGSWLSDEVGAIREGGGPRILVTVTEAPGADRLIERAAQMAAQVGGEFIGVHVRTGAGRQNGGLDARRQLLEELGGDYREVAGDDVAAALLAVARAEGATQLVVGTSRRPWWRELISGSIIRDLVRGSEEIDVHVIATPEAVGTRRPLGRRRLSGVGSRRRRVGYLVGLVGLVVLTMLLNAFDQPPALSSILLSYLALVVAASGIGGAGPAVLTALGAFGLADFFFTTPYHAFVIDEPSVVVALVVFASVAAVVSWLVDHAARRQAEADRAGAEARTLSRLTTTLFESDEPLPQLVTDLVATYELDAAALLRRHNGGWRVEAACGDPPPRSPDQGADTIDLPDDYALVLAGGESAGTNRRVLTAFAAQLAVALAARRLQEEAAAATEQARINQLRASLLSAVSHDLRTPLSSIKASATSLLSDDVTWSPSAIEGFARAIVEEADRLNGLVGNLLDLSRLQADAVQLELRPVVLEEVVPNALRGLNVDASRITIDGIHELPAVRGDPLLVERIVANLLDNALKWSPVNRRVHLRGSATGAVVQLHVVDHGPGIPEAVRDEVFQPFQRHGDTRRGEGVGLGLAVARGFAEAMAGQLKVQDTPGGGATMVLTLQGAPA